jgi:hypothetical protein
VTSAILAGTPVKLSSTGMTAEDTRIALCTWSEDGRVFVIVDHPGQPADYVHGDGTVWTWHQRWHLVGGVPAHDGMGMVGRTHLRAYDLATPEQ